VGGSGGDGNVVAVGVLVGVEEDGARVLFGEFEALGEGDGRD